MAEYIDLNNTEVLAEAGENAKLVVEEDGELKRIPASAVGQVKTVNGVEPDEAGNVVVSSLPEGAAAHQQLVTDETGAAKWEARTHYVAPDGTVHPLDSKYIPESIARTADVNAAVSALGTVLRFKGAVATVDLLPTEGNELGDVYYVTEGSSGYAWIQDADGTQRWEQLGPMISGEFLPTGATAHQQLVTDGEGKAKWEDKAFYETGWRYAWDGDTSNMTAVSTNGLGTLYKVSESVVDFDAMVGEVSVTAVIEGVERAIVIDITDEMVAMWKEAGAMMFGPGTFYIFAVVDKDKMSANSELVELIPELNEMEVGVYFSEKTREIKSADYTVKPLDAKFLPEGVGGIPYSGSQYYFETTDNGETVDLYKTEVEFDGFFDVEEAIEYGMPVILRDSKSTEIMRLVSYYFESGVGNVFTFYSAVLQGYVTVKELKPSGSLVISGYVS